MKKLKKLLIAGLSLSLLAAAALPALPALADDNEPDAVTSQTPVIAPAPDAVTDTAADTAADGAGLAINVNGRELDARASVMVPLREVAEELGFTVSWDNGTVTVTGSERYVELTVGEDKYFAAPTQEGMMGASLFSLGSAPCSVNGCTYVPLELFDALLGCMEGAVTVENGAVQINTAPDTANGTQIPNPFTGHDSLAEAAKAAGFELTAPESVNGSPQRDIETMGSEMIQVFYGDVGNDVCIRKAPGDGDISGDYSVYAQTDVVTVDGADVTMKGENGTVFLALWTNGGYAYSVFARAGMSGADMSALVRSVK